MKCYGFGVAKNAMDMNRISSVVLLNKSVFYPVVYKYIKYI